ncbi:TetR/AcrR family transcriptional regulator [Alicyclobacillus fodiniaquatilis]|uniref:TetR/AcrR family transcriptional regulator n=1 Tax=Alicyclobacillus fodiniaquatilis TaxID=1661150 RepID=A0ABW4JFJ0_9BACL
MGFDSPNCRYSDEELKTKLIMKLLIPIKNDGLANLRADDIAKYMDLSKATMYKYFESKDDVIEHFVNFFIKLFDVSPALDKTSGSYQERYHVVFKKMLMVANYGSEVFRRDLRALYPELMERLHAAWLARNVALHDFYEQGMKDGVFVRANVELLIMQDELCFAKLGDASALIARNLTCKQAMLDYYEMRVHQLFAPESRPNVIHDEATLAMLNVLSQKLTSMMM